MFFKITDEEASKIRTETASHGNAKRLDKKLSIESETVACTYEFSQPNKCVCRRRVSGTSVQKMSESNESVVVRNMCVQ